MNLNYRFNVHVPFLVKSIDMGNRVGGVANLLHVSVTAFPKSES